MLVDGDAADTVGDDMSRCRILDVLNMSADIGLDSGILKHTVAHGVDGAVLEHQTIGIAEQLLSGEVTIHQTDILRVPSQILPIERGVIDGDVFALPERVFC